MSSAVFRSGLEARRHIQIIIAASNTELVGAHVILGRTKIAVFLWHDGGVSSEDVVAANRRTPARVDVVGHRRIGGPFRCVLELTIVRGRERVRASVIGQV